MFTNRHEIRRIDLVKRDYTQVVPTQKNAVALDVDVASNRMFWCDRFHRRIYRYGAPSCGNAAVQHTGRGTERRSQEAQALFVSTVAQEVEKSFSNQEVASSIPCRSVLLARHFTPNCS